MEIIRLHEDIADMVILEIIRRAIGEDADELVRFMEHILPEGTKVNYDPEASEVVIDSELDIEELFPVDLAKIIKGAQ
jgi:hypothetical protein